MLCDSNDFKAMTHQPRSNVVDLNVFCDTSQTLSGTAFAADLNDLNTFVHGSLEPVSWAVRGSNKPVKGAQYDSSIESTYRFLHVQANTRVALTCGRCLTTMPVELQVDTALQVFQTEQAADDAAMTEDPDSVPDPIVTHRQFDLMAQVQEELLLNIPDNPCHEVGNPVCQLPASVDNTQASPFAMLRSLKST